MDLPDLFQKSSECSKRIMGKSCPGNGGFESVKMSMRTVAMRFCSRPARAAERARLDGGKPEV